MDIAFCVNSTYVPYSFVTLKSILVNNPNEDISLLTESRRKIEGR